MITLVFARGPQASGPCKMEVYNKGFEEWHDLAEGFLYGLHKNPPARVEDCSICDRMGLAVGGIQLALVNL